MAQNRVMVQDVDLAQMISRLDALSAQQTHILAAIQQGRLEQGKIQITLDALRRAIQSVLDSGQLSDVELHDVVADLVEKMESSPTLEHKLELSLPFLPLLLSYTIGIDLRLLWDNLQSWMSPESDV